MNLRRSTRTTVPLQRRIMSLYFFVLRLLERAKYKIFVTSIEIHKTGTTLLVLIIDRPALQRWKKIRWKSRSELYDLVYSLRWGDEVTTTNYGFAPAETDEPERFQLQIYAELRKLLAHSNEKLVAKDVLEISCGRGGGLCHLIGLLPVKPHAIGLDFSINAIRYCTHSYTDHPNVAFVCGHALRLPFRDMSFDVVVNVEASHIYRDDAAFLREVSQNPESGVASFSMPITDAGTMSPRWSSWPETPASPGPSTISPLTWWQHVNWTPGEDKLSSAPQCPWYYRVLANERLKRYAAVPGTVNFERFRGGDRLYFMTCLTRLR